MPAANNGRLTIDTGAGQRTGSSTNVQAAVVAYLQRMVDVVSKVDARQLTGCFDALWNAWQDDRAVFIVGNGGSASTASHMANDLSKQAFVYGRKPLRALALTDNVETLTAIANDTGYENIFSTQLRTHARSGDVLILVSCSGNSPNLVKAIETATQLGMKTVALGGMDGGRTREMCDVYVHVPSHDYGQVETAHLMFEHLLTNLLRQAGKTAVKPAILIDRDGVIVKNRGDYVKSRLEMQVLPGALEAVADLTKNGHRVFVVTNQSAIGRGLTTFAEVESMHRQLAFELSCVGGEIEAFLVCPHRPEDRCSCRKPAPGLLHQARDRFGIDLNIAVLIGDWITDVQAAKAAGCASILVKNGHNGLRGDARKQNGHKPNGHADHVVKDLPEAVQLILSANGNGIGRA